MEADLALLCHAGLTVQAVTQELGMQAGRIRARRYHRERAAVSLADCVAAAAALALGSPLATSDPALADVLRSEGGNVHRSRTARAADTSRLQRGQTAQHRHPRHPRPPRRNSNHLHRHQDGRGRQHRRTANRVA